MLIFNFFIRVIFVFIFLIPSISYASTSWTTGAYGNNQDTSETLSISGASSLSVKVEGRTEGGYDYFYIYDANGSEIKKLDGEINKTFTVSGSSIRARLVTDHSNTDSGVTVTITASTSGSGGTSWDTGSYGNNQDISKTLSISGASSLSVKVEGRTEGNYDYFYIYDANGSEIKKLDGEINETFTVSGSSIRARLITDRSGRYSGVTITISKITSGSSSYPVLTKENFNITYGNANSDKGVENGVHTVNMDLGFEESQYGIVTLYRKKLSGTTYRYEFTLSARGSNDIKNIFFIALVEKDANFIKLPVKVQDRHNNELIGVSGNGVEIREGSGDFYAYTKSGFRNGVSNALHAVGGFAVGKTPAGDAVSLFGFAKNITGAMFAAADEGVELLVGSPVGLKADKHKVLPSEKFSDNVADINNYHAYRLIIPTPSNYTTELNGVRFSIDIEDNFSSFSEPRFYLSWINEKNIDEQVILELGTKDHGNLRNYDTYIRAASRWIAAFE